MSSPKPAASNESPEALRDQLERALEERDRALVELARERERVNALRLWARFPAEVDPARYPSEVGPDGTPLRYVVADRLNEGLKGLLGPLHEKGRALFEGKGKKEGG